MYGPGFSFAGQLRYVEVVLVGAAVLNFNAVFRHVGAWEKRFIGLFLLAALSQIIADEITNADVSGTIKRVGTYILLGMLIAILRWLGRNSWTRIRWILFGYCVSYLTFYLSGLSSIPVYNDLPWRLGLGYAVTLGICVCIAWRPKFVRPGAGAGALACLAVIHFYSGARSLSIIVLIVAILAIVSSFRKRPKPRSLNAIGLFVYVCIGFMVAFGTYKAAEFGTHQRWYPPELQAKMEEQFSSPYGLIAAARPDTAAALYAIRKRPLMGHGSTNVDPDVWRYYVDLNTAVYRRSNSYNDFYSLYLDQEWSFGTPSHSHLFGAWADGGLLAMLGWLTLLGLSLYMGSRAALWSSGLAPLTNFVALSNVWDILVSPGPHRMDVAVRLMVLLFALSYFRRIDGGNVEAVAREPKHLLPGAAIEAGSMTLRR